MEEERRQASFGQYRVCDLSIRGEAIASPVRPASAVCNRTTGEVNIEAVFEACRRTTAETGRARPATASAATDVRRTCRGASPCTGATSQWDFDPFLKDNTGRMISTKTPVAKMTAPISMAKKPRAESATGRRQIDTPSVENKSVNRPKTLEALLSRGTGMRTVVRTVTRTELACRPDSWPSQSTSEKQMTGKKRRPSSSTVNKNKTELERPPSQTKPVSSNMQVLII